MCATLRYSWAGAGSIAACRCSEMNGVTWYFLDNKYYFGRPYIYGSGRGRVRAATASSAGPALNALPLLDFQPGHSPRA